MTSGRDDDALSWSGDDDPTLDVGTRPADGRDAVADADVESATDETVDAAPPALPDGYTAVGRGSDEVGRIDADGAVTMPGERVRMSNAALIALGVFGGVYLLYVVGWIIGGLRLQARQPYLVSDPMFQGAFWLAVLAPVLWFSTVYVLTARLRAWVRIVALMAGVLLLVPWPFIAVGGSGL